MDTFWEFIWGVQDTWVDLRPFLNFGREGALGLQVVHCTDGKLESITLRSPRTREQDRGLRNAITEATGFWTMAKVVGHTATARGYTSIPWVQQVLAQLTEQVHASIFQLAAKDPRITAALT